MIPMTLAMSSLEGHPVETGSGIEIRLIAVRSVRVEQVRRRMDSFIIVSHMFEIRCLTFVNILRISDVKRKSSLTYVIILQLFSFLNAWPNFITIFFISSFSQTYGTTVYL